MGARNRESGGGLRPWTSSFGLALLIVVVGVALSSAVNPILGRTIHWDWTAALSSVLLVVLAVAVRRRWV